MKSSPEELRAAVSNAVDDAVERRGMGVGAAGAKARVSALAGYTADEMEGLPAETVMLFSGCGNPTRWARLEPGESVLELGCGGGLDLLLAARKLGSEGHVVGVDFNDAICERARANAESANDRAIEIVGSLAESLPFEQGRFDCVMTNGLLCLSPDKERILTEARQMLRPGGRVIFCEVVVQSLPEWVGLSRPLFTAGVAGAFEVEALQDALRAESFTGIELCEHRVLETDALEALIDGGLGGIEVAGCSASGAIMGSEAAAALTGHVGIATVRART